MSFPEASPAYAAPTSMEDVRALIAVELAELDGRIRASLDSEVVLIQQVAEYIIGSGGKRLRPVIHLLAAGALGDRSDTRFLLAAIIEFIHTATLLHDDVVDGSELRRGDATANAVWGNAASVLVGDFLYSRAFQLMVEADSMRVMSILAETTNTIAEGEVLQLLHMGNPDTDEARYREVIRSKTAKLFEASARLAAVRAGAPTEVEEALAIYGSSLGLAFQLADDVLDYTGDADSLGKNTGDDLAEGKPTLPLIRVLEVGSEAQRQLVREVIRHGDRSRLAEVLAAIRDTDALSYTRQQAEHACAVAADALTCLPDSAYKNALIFLSRFACERTT